MRVLVVGGAGYVGSHVVLALIERGHKVTVFDNLSSGSRANLFPEAEFVFGDILQEGDLAACFDGTPFEAVIHLAALKAAGESMVDPGRYSLQNLNGSNELLRQSDTHGTGVFLFSSSAAVYGDPEYLPLDEKHPLNPANYYGFTKLQIEQNLEWFARLRGLRYGSLRYFNAAGYDPAGRVRGLERNPHNLIPIVMEVAAGKRNHLNVFGDDYATRDGSCIRDYVHVTDLAEAHVRALEALASGEGNLILNLGSERGHSVLEVLAAARHLTGEPIPHRAVGRRPGDPAILTATSAQARAILGWQPRYSDLESVLATTWAMYARETE